ncbi:hypothetical protein [Desulfovibrio sp. TomC]|uniref:hypothetical protein n=1 Tax=Desulfovibrio sp. TomC TaxID=1562888 RepID=UPI0005756063|nr:hypothetical protein [Desulfovibrio sp. TomC]KHK03008.1 hypothetical protein NY78_1537 [Desulfovibrio sp. TomC]
MAGSGRIDILILRDASSVGRYRLPVWLVRLLVFTPVVFLLLLGAAVAVAYHLHQDNKMLTDRAGALRQEIDAAGEGLLRLENLERTLRSKDLTELETLLGSYNPDNPSWWKPRVEARKDTAPTSPASPTSPAESGKERPDLSKVLARVDANQAGVDNLKFKFDNRRLNLGFDLSNVTPQTGLAGKVEVALVGNDGTVWPLRADKDELSFQIQRFKQIATSLSLPAKAEPRDMYGLRLIIVDSAGKPVFAQVYPLQKD